MSDPFLSVQDLRVDFPEIIAANRISFDLHAGDVYGLIGPNGAGKTTTIRAIAGLQEITFGTVRIEGMEMSQEPARVKRLLGFMPDFSPVYDNLTTTEFLDHFARAYGVENRSQRIHECLELTWLLEKENALCKGLSRGMKQRLIFAKTLLPNPKVLLLDEPASGLDPLGRIELRKLILQLRDAGKAVLISSHILSEMAEFCNKVGIMERGKLLRSGSVKELISVEGARRMLLKWREEHEAPAKLLSSNAAVTQLKIKDREATFQFSGSTEALDNLLAALIQQGARVSEWRPLEGDLEQILLQSGAKDVS